MIHTRTLAAVACHVSSNLGVWLFWFDQGPEQAPHKPQHCKRVKHNRPAIQTNERSTQQQPNGTAHVQATKHRRDSTCAFPSVVVVGHAIITCKRRDMQS